MKILNVLVHVVVSDSAVVSIFSFIWNFLRKQRVQSSMANIDCTLNMWIIMYIS